MIGKKHVSVAVFGGCDPVVVYIFFNYGPHSVKAAGMRENNMQAGRRAWYGVFAGLAYIIASFQKVALCPSVKGVFVAGIGRQKYTWPPVLVFHSVKNTSIKQWFVVVACIDSGKISLFKLFHGGSSFYLCLFPVFAHAGFAPAPLVAVAAPGRAFYRFMSAYITLFSIISRICCMVAGLLMVPQKSIFSSW